MLQVLHAFKVLALQASFSCCGWLSPRVGGAAGDTGPSLRGVRAEKKRAENLLLELCAETAINGFSNMYHICVPELVAPNTMDKYEKKILSTVGRIN